MDTIDTVSLDTNQGDNLGPVNIDTGITSAPVPPDVAQRKAEKIVASGVLPDKTKDQITNSILAGEEQLLRQEGAARTNYNIALQRSRKLTDAIKSSGGTLTLDQFQKLQNDIDNPSQFLNQLTSPDSVFEKGFAQYAMGKLADTVMNGDSDLKQAMLEAPQVAQAYIDKGTEFTAKNAVVDNLIQDAQDTINNQSWIGWGADLAKSAIPIVGQLYAEYKLRGNTPGVSTFSGLGGMNLEEQGQKAYTLPFNEFTKFVTDKYNALKKDNPSLALAWLHGIRGQSTGTEALNNLFTLAIPADLITAGGVVKNLITRTARAVIVRNAVRDVTQAAATKGDVEVEAIAATGDTSTTAEKKASQRIISNFKGTNQPVKDALDALPSGLKQDVEDIKANPSRLGQTLTNMLTDMYDASVDRLMNVATTVARVQRIPLEQITETQMRELKEHVAADYPHLSNSILDIADPVYNKISNTYNIDIALGKPGAELFRTQDLANTFAKVNGITDYKLESQGAGYYLRVTKNLNEEDSVIRDLLVSSEEGKSKEGFFTGVTRLGWLRTSEDTVSDNARINRKVATYAQARLTTLANEERKYLRDVKAGTIRFDPVTGAEIPWYKRKPANVYNYIQGRVTGRAKQNWKRLERILAANQTMRDEDKQLGMYFKGPGDFENFYQQIFNEMPTPEETAAYFANKRLNEIDRSLRNIAVFRNKARLGAKSYALRIPDETGKLVSSPSFDGIQQHNFPGGDDTILIADNNGKNRFINVGGGSAPYQVKEINKLRDQVTSGELKVIRIFDPEARPLAGFNGIKQQRIRYIVAPSFEEGPLSWNQVPRRGGGHFEYEYDYYIKQAKIRPEKIGKKFTNWYEGDTTVMPVELKGMGKDIVNKLNTVRQLLRQKDVAGAKAFAEKNLPIEWNELRKWFGKKGRLSLTEPFYVVPKNRSILDLDKSLPRRYEYTDEQGNIKTTFKDGTRSGSDARQFQIEYTGQRDSYDMFTFKDVGTRHNPLYQAVQAKLADPIPVLNRALAKITESFFMDDIKISQMEQWVQEYRDVLQASDSELRHSPFWHFNNPVYLKTDNDARVSLAKQNRFKIKQFVGTPDTVDTYLHSLASRLVETTYEHLGPKAAALVPHWLIYKVRDPLTFIRSMTYHFKLGLFAVPQLLVQNQTYANIFAISPRASLAGTYGAFLHQWSRMNPAMLDTLDRLATKIKIPGFHSWKPGEFKEANRELINTGFGNVGGEYVNLDAMSKYRVVRNAGTTFLDWGQTFFKEGEQNVRFGAWYTAFKEYRLKHPTGAITEIDRAKILDRADLLYTNMSRASASALHTGALSLTSQFMSYQMRLAELFLGKRLGPTWQKRALARLRLLGVNSILYGIPVGIGVTGLPLEDYLRKSAFANGYVVGDNWISSLAREGLPALAAAWTTGEGNAFDVPERLETGNWYDVGHRFGSTGFDQIVEAINGDSKWWEVVLGPSGAIAGNTIFNGYKLGTGITQWLWANLAGVPNPYPLKVDDLLDTFNQVTSVSSARKMIYAMNTGKWISNNETQYTEPGVISPANAAFMAVTGLSPTSAVDTQYKREMLNDIFEAQRDAAKEATVEFHRSLDAADANDYAQAKDYRTRALAILTRAGYPPEKVGAFISKALQGRYSGLINRINLDLYFEYAPQDKKQQYLDTFIRILKQEQLRGQ